MMKAKIMIIDEYPAGARPDPMRSHPKGKSRRSRIFSAEVFVGNDRPVAEQSRCFPRARCQLPVNIITAAIAILTGNDHVNCPGIDGMCAEKRLDMLVDISYAFRLI